jgi:hypothetical protein
MKNKFGEIGIYQTSEKVMFVLFSLFSLSLPFSKSFISIITVAILVFALYFCVKDKKHTPIKFSDKTLWLIMSVFGVYLFWMIFTNNIGLAIYELNKALPWVLIPLGIYLSPRLNKKSIWVLLSIFIIGVFVATLIGFTKMLFYQNLGIVNFRHTSFISHIQFSFQIALSIFIIFFSFQNDYGIISKQHWLIRVVVIVWMLLFMMFLKSFLVIISFLLTSLIFLFIWARNIKSLRAKVITYIIALSIVLLPSIYLGKALISFYTIKETEKEKVEHYTKRGNEYCFNFDNKQKENGWYVGWYICESELEEEWNKKSNIKYNQKNKTGYNIAGTLQRYLTSKGLKKDAEGVKMLTPRDIENIENGLANHIYDSPIYAIYPRVYETIWELDNYLTTRNPNDKSLSKRIEFTKAALYIIKENTFWGIGTGNYKEAYMLAFEKIESKLNDKNFGVVHNQYLSYLVKFGIIGFLLICISLGIVLIINDRYKNPLFLSFFIFMLIANIGDSNWETHIGLSFFLFFLSLFCWHWNTNENTKPIQH